LASIIKKHMLQRIQTIYLLIAAGVSAGLIHVFPLYMLNLKNITAIYAKNDVMFLSMFLASAILSIVTIFLFKNRKLQFVLGRLNIILNFILLGFFVYQSRFYRVFGISQ